MRYTWGNLGAGLMDSVISGRLSAQILERFTGMESYPFEHRRDAALTEMIASTPQVFNVKSYGAKGDGIADDTVALQAAIDAVGNGDQLFWPRGQYRVTAPLLVNYKAQEWVSTAFNQAGIHYEGTGACIQLGTDDGNAYDASEYNGAAPWFTIYNMAVDYTGLVGLSGLLNGGGNYKAGAYAIQDWRGGDVRVIRCSFQGWDTAIWGVQSDNDYFEDCIFILNHVCAYFGPRSDQATVVHCQTLLNDQAWNIEGVGAMRFDKWISNGDGSATTNPVKIRNSVYSATRRASGIVFDTPWLESLSDGPVVDVEAFFDIGGGDAQPNATLMIRNPSIFTNLYSTGSVRHTKYLVRCDNVKSVVVDGIHGTPGAIPWNNLQAVFKVINDGGSTAVPTLWFNDYDGIGGRTVENYSGTVCFIHIQSGLDQSSYTVNVVGGTGGVRVGLLNLQRNLGHSNAAPGAGTWSGGDLTLNRSWVQGSANIFGWIAGGGSPGHHYPLVWPSCGADRGDLGVTLAVASDHMHQRWATALTAPRTVTLSTTGADNGTMWFITREATATGASGLDVGGLKTLAVGQWCIVMYDGGAYRLRAFGSL